MNVNSWPKFDQREEELLLEAFHSGHWWRGAYDTLEGEAAHSKGFVQRFEKAIGEMLQVKHSLAVSSGTMALDMAIRSLNLEVNDEVITTPYTYAATATCILQSGAVPVFADIDLETWNLDPNAVRRACTERTKAIIVVHFAGKPCDMDAFLEIAQDYNLVLIEDAAHAIGATWKGRPVGTIGDIGCFSFQASKNVTTGEGGAIVTNNDDVASTLYSLHMAGRRVNGEWYDHQRLGWNGRMTEFQGAIGIAQLEKFQELHRIREDNAVYVTSMLSQLAGITPQCVSDESSRHGLHLICFRYDKEYWGGMSPKRLFMAFRSAGIPIIRGYERAIYYNEVFLNPPAFAHKADRIECNWKEQCPNTEIISKTTFWLHHSLLLAERSEIQDILQKIADVQVKMNKLAVRSGSEC
ncbi:DegT/DnrJ/EryC1/StrS family aminotransferase [Paenibacillus sp. NPDC057934]|uniref:DegT/DnrJ/EryC1/StrS family aminotransferase n=1 Tax=Paenibacillus sp. NPDC057934 TaxID=3346282 RepID=UPI0036D8DE86